MNMEIERPVPEDISEQERIENNFQVFERGVREFNEVTKLLQAELAAMKEDGGKLNGVTRSDTAELSDALILHPNLAAQLVRDFLVRLREYKTILNKLADKLPLIKKEGIKDRFEKGGF